MGVVVERCVDGPNSRLNNLTAKKTPNHQKPPPHSRKSLKRVPSSLSYLQSNGLGSNPPFSLVHKVSPVIMSFPNRHQCPMPVLGNYSSERETKEQRKKTWACKDSSLVFL